ncbi:MAG: hypothetical protein KAU52_01150, partial [Methanosarcinales archaeon]|nr:hypothetical protein [Methanosarcinales archaeon]
MNNRTIIMIAMVAVVMMMGTASATVHVLSEPATNFTTGTYKAGAVISVVTFGINQTGSETLDNVTVIVLDEGGGIVSNDFANLTVYTESGATAGFQLDEDLLNGTNASAVNIGTGTEIGTSTAVIGTGETTFYVVATLAAAPGDTHNFSVNLTDGGIVASTGAVTTTLLDGTAIATIDTAAPTLSSAARDTDTQINVTMSESVTALDTGSDGGFIVAKNGAPGTTYTVSAIAAGGSAEFVILTVADMATSGAAGVNVTYNATDANGTITDIAGNDLATDATGVTIAAWETTPPTLSSAA